MNYLSEINGWLKKNEYEILQTLSKLIQIKTENLPPGGNEKPGQEYLYNKIVKFIPEKDIDIFEVDDVEGIRRHPLFFPTMDGIEKVYRDRPNLVAKLKGKGGGKSLVFSGHMDTMPASGQKWKVFDDPFSGKIKDERMYGRGSVDMKAGTLSGFFALKCLHDLKIKLKGDVFAESVIDEENGGVNGTVACRLRNPDIDFAILSESTNLAVGVETIGGSDWIAMVSEKGPGGIGVDIDLTNPVYKLSKIALALEKYGKEMNNNIRIPENYEKDMKLRLLTYQISSGGSTYLESGSVPTKGHIYFWLETFEYMSERDVKKKFVDFMRKELGEYDDFKEEFPKFEAVIRFMGGHRTNLKHPAMVSIKKAYQLLNIKYEEKGLGFACDAYTYKGVTNTDVAIIGPAGANPHGIDEYVEINSVFELIKIMVLTAIDYCGSGN